MAAEVVEKAKRGPQERNVARSIAAGAKQLTPDRHGRIVVPTPLREYADLDRDVVVNGAFNRVEIWDAAKWHGVNAESDEQLRAAGEGLWDIAL